MDNYLLWCTNFIMGALGILGVVFAILVLTTLIACLVSVIVRMIEQRNECPRCGANKGQMRSK